MKLAELEQALGHEFQDRNLLLQALTHRSFSTSHNERLEFLGDSILDCAIAQALFERFPKLREGDLSRLRANLVCQETLVGIAHALDLGGHMRLGEGERKSGGDERPSILADALEALFGAVLVDGGLESARRAVLHLYAPQLEGLDPRVSGKDAKTRLQEYLQAQHLALPQYQLSSTRGAAHAQEFEVECRIPALDLQASGVGRSRRLAEQEAARLILERILEK